MPCKHGMSDWKACPTCFREALTVLVTAEELAPDPTMQQWGMLPSECAHHPLGEAEFVQLMVDSWGGSWQNLYNKLSRQGWGLIKV